MSTTRFGVGDSGSDRSKALRKCKVSFLPFLFPMIVFFQFLTDFFLAAAIAANQDILGPAGHMTRQQQDSSLEDQSLMMPAQFDEGGAFFSESGFSEVFDSLNWVFDGIPDSFVAPPVL